MPGMVSLCSQRPFRSLLSIGNGERSVFALPTDGRATDPSGLFEGLQCLSEAFVFDRQRLPELGPCEGFAIVQQCQYLVLEAGLFLVLNFRPDLQMGGLGVGNKLQIHRR